MSQVAVNLTEHDLQRLSNLQVPISKNEKKRLSSIRSSHVLESTLNAGTRFNNLTHFASRVFKVPIAIINIVDIDQNIILSKVNMPFDVYNRNLSICTYTVMEESPPILLITDAINDEQFKNHPAVVGPPHVRFYAGAPIMWSGMKIGVFCLLDMVPHEDLMTLKNIAILQDLAGLVSDSINEHYESLQVLESQKAKLLVSGMHNLASPLENGNDVYSEMKVTVDELKKVLVEFDAFKQSSLVTESELSQNMKISNVDDQIVPTPFDDSLEVSSHNRNANDLVLQSFVDMNETQEMMTDEIDMTDEKILHRVAQLSESFRPSIVSFDQNIFSSSLSQYNIQVQIYAKRLEDLKSSFLNMLSTFKSMLIILSQQIECNIQVLLLLTTEELQLSSFIYEMESMTMEDISYYLNTILRSQFPNLHFAWNNDDWDKSNFAMNIAWDTLLKILHYTMLSTITSTHHHHQFDMIHNSERQKQDKNKKPQISTLIIASIENAEHQPISCPHTFPVTEDGKSFLPQISRLNFQIIHYFDYTLPPNQEYLNDQIDISSDKSHVSYANVEEMTAKQTKRIANALRNSTSIAVTSSLGRDNTCDAEENLVFHGASRIRQMLIDYDVIEFCKGWMYEEILQGLIGFLPALRGHYALLDEEDVFNMLHQINQVFYQELIASSSAANIDEEVMIRTVVSPLPYQLLEGFQIEFPCEIFHFVSPSAATVLNNRVEYNSRVRKENEVSTSGKDHKLRPRLTRNVLLRNNSLKSVHTYKHMQSTQRSASNHSTPSDQPSVSIDRPVGSSIHRRIPADNGEQRRSYDFQSLLNFPSLLARTFSVIGSTSLYASHRTSVYHENNVLQEPICSPMRPKKKPHSNRHDQNKLAITLYRNNDSEHSNSISASSLRELQRQRQQRRASSESIHQPLSANRAQPQQVNPREASADAANNVENSTTIVVFPSAVSKITSSISTRCDSSTLQVATTPKAATTDSSKSSSIRRLWDGMMRWFHPQNQYHASLLPLTSSNTSQNSPKAVMSSIPLSCNKSTQSCFNHEEKFSA